MTAYAAYLRVYEPLTAFPEPERRHWEDYVRSGAAPERTLGVALERQQSLNALLSAVPPPLVEHAFVVVVDGVAMVCPWRTRLRSWEAIADFRAGLPDDVADAFVSRPLADAAERELDRWRAEHPERRSHILTSTWQVPLRWFVLFEPAERRLVLGRRRAGRPGGAGTTGTGSGGGTAATAGAGAGSAGTAAPSGHREDLPRSLLYVTAMSRARRRVARALAVLRRTVQDGEVIDGVEDLGRWLEEFHPRSRVELDYAGLVHLLDDDTLRADESARDVNTALARLTEGDRAAATAAYQRVTERWRTLQALESAN